MNFNQKYICVYIFLDLLVNIHAYLCMACFLFQLSLESSSKATAIDKQITLLGILSETPFFVVVAIVI